MGTPPSENSHLKFPVNLTDREELLSLLHRVGLRPTKALGQHFLVSEVVVDAILEAVGSPAGVLEIGPGPGVLTSRLAESLPAVTAVEIDPIAISALALSAPKARVIKGDCLEVDLSSLLQELPEPRVLVSNMPYNITGPLLERITDIRDQFAHAVLMMQAEVGQKIMARPGNRAAGALTIAMQTYFEIAKVRDVGPPAFYPPPEVHSIVIKLTPRETELGEDIVPFLKFVRHGFHSPRKTLANNLGGIVDRVRLADYTAAQGWTPTIRPHEIGRDDWIALWRALHK